MVRSISLQSVKVERGHIFVIKEFDGIGDLHPTELLRNLAIIDIADEYGTAFRQAGQALGSPYLQAAEGGSPEGGVVVAGEQRRVFLTVAFHVVPAHVPGAEQHDGGVFL